MEGVTILSATTTTLGISWGLAIILALIMFAIFLAIDPLDEREFNGWRIGLATVMAILSFGVLALFCVDTTEVAQYKVIIDESVSFVEFNEKYKIIDQEGEIYTIQERE